MEKQIEFLVNLINRTKSGKISWETAPSPNSYFVSFANYTATIYVKQRSNSVTEDYYIEIIDKFGAVVEKFSDVDLSANGVVDAEDQMRELLTRARRYALGSDAALDQILSELKGGERA
jgi:hypothetical protein